MKRRPLRNTTQTKQQSSAQLRPLLTQSELREQGNRFMRDGLLRLATQQKRSIATEPQQPNVPEKTDYLIELRQQRTTQGSSRAFSLDEGKIERILQSGLCQ